MQIIAASDMTKKWLLALKMLKILTLITHQKHPFLKACF